VIQATKVGYTVMGYWSYSERWLLVYGGTLFCVPIFILLNIRLRHEEDADLQSWRWLQKCRGFIVESLKW